MININTIVGLTVLFLLSCNSENDRVTYSKVTDEFLIMLENNSGLDEWDAQQAYSSTIIGTTMNDFEFTTIHGKNIRLSDFDKPIFLEMTASWCGPCVSAIPAINEIANKYKDEIEMILITHDTAEKAKIFAEKFDEKIIIIPSENDIDPTKFIKSKSSNFVNVLPFPTTFFLDNELKITKVVTGGPRVGTYVSEGDTTTTTAKHAFDYNLRKFETEIQNLLTTNK